MLRSLPLFVRLRDRPFILVGEGMAAEPKRRLLERAGALIVGEEGVASLAIVALEDETEALAAVERLRARGILVNAVDRPALCDFTLPALVERDPVIVAIGTDGRSAGLAAALRQRLEALLPATLGTIAERLFAARGALAQRFPQAGDRRRAIADALAAGGALDLLGDAAADDGWISGTRPGTAAAVPIRLRSADPDELTLREARWLARADRVRHRADVPPAILARARADAERIEGPEQNGLAEPGFTVDIGMA